MAGYRINPKQMIEKKERYQYKWQDVADLLNLPLTTIEKALANMVLDVDEFLTINIWVNQKTDKAKEKELRLKKQKQKKALDKINDFKNIKARNRRKLHNKETEFRNENKKIINSTKYIKEFIHHKDEQEPDRIYDKGTFERIEVQDVTDDIEVYYRYIKPISKIRSKSLTRLSERDFKFYVERGDIQLFKKIK